MVTVPDQLVTAERNIARSCGPFGLIVNVSLRNPLQRLRHELPLLHPNRRMRRPALLLRVCLSKRVMSTRTGSVAPRMNRTVEHRRSS